MFSWLWPGARKLPGERASFPVHPQVLACLEGESQNFSLQSLPLLSQEGTQAQLLLLLLPELTN